MKAALLWPADPTSTPPRPAIVGTEEGLLIGDLADAPFEWLPCAVVAAPINCVHAALTPHDPTAPLPTELTGPYEVIDLNEYLLHDSDGACWAVRAGYGPQVGMWFTRGEPRYMPDIDAFLRGPIDTPAPSC